MTDPRRILIVDDQVDILELTRVVLSDAGYSVAVAGGGEAALEHLDRNPCDLVLLDINMPRMDGWETLRLIRADERLAGLPVVMFSVKGEIVDKVLGLQEGALDFITKPFIVDDLVQRIARILTRPGCEGRGGRPAPPAVP